MIRIVRHGRCAAVQVVKRCSRVGLVQKSLAAFVDDVQKQVTVNGTVDFRIGAVCLTFVGVLGVLKVVLSSA